MALRLPTRPNAVLAVLAAVAFATMLAVSNRDRLPSLGLAIAAESVVLFPAPAKRQTLGGAQATLAQAPTSEQQRTAVPYPERARRSTPPREPSAEQLQLISQLRDQVMPQGESTAEDAEDRGNAIRQLATLPGSLAAQALIHVVRNEEDPRNRILAIEGLRRAGAAGDADGMIRDALSEASSSSDEVIAAQARAVYDELVAELGAKRWRTQTRY
jgi:hypothetical protein